MSIAARNECGILSTAMHRQLRAPISLTGKSHDYAIDLQAPICCARLPKAKLPRYRNRRSLTFMRHDIKERARVARAEEKKRLKGTTRELSIEFRALLHSEFSFINHLENSTRL